MIHEQCLVEKVGLHFCGDFFHFLTISSEKLKFGEV